MSRWRISGRPDFPDFTLPLFADLKRVFKTEAGEAMIFPASGTGGWEAALTNMLSPGDKVLTSRFRSVLHALGGDVRAPGP